MNKILIAGRMSAESLENSYRRAFTQLGWQVDAWDIPSAEARNARLGRAGRYINHFWPAEPWIAKANSELLTRVFDLRPDVLVVTGIWRVLAGTLAQIKASLPGCHLVLLWPDTLLNCQSHTLASIPVYDLIASYGQASTESFRRLGARRCEWVPLAFDPELHPATAENKLSGGPLDVSFVGNYSAERENVMKVVVANGLRLGIWGEPVRWQAKSVDPAVRACYRGGPLWAQDFASAVRTAPLSLNPIARSNFPSANMRFFEIPGAGGTQICGACPEMESEFPDGERCFYYRQPEQAAAVISALLSDVERLRQVGVAARQHVLARHTYVHRAQLILDLLSGAAH